MQIIQDEYYYSEQKVQFFLHLALIIQLFLKIKKKLIINEMNNKFLLAFIILFLLQQILNYLRL